MPPPPERDSLIASHLAQIDAVARQRDLPVVGLAGPPPTSASLGAYHTQRVAPAGPMVVTSVELIYGDPAVGPEVRIRTDRLPPPSDPVHLRGLLEAELVRSGDVGGMGEGKVEAVDLLVDRKRRPATLVRARAGAWAARCAHDGAVITLVVRGRVPDELRLVSVTDLEPYVRRQREQLDSMRIGSAQEHRPAPVDVKNPHRALVEASLRHSLEDNVADPRGHARRDSIELDRLGGLWEATVMAQMRLAEQSRKQADDAVGALVNQLVRLQQDASWFTRDAPLRAAAIAESLIYWTELRKAVPSRAAHASWQRLMRTQAALSATAGGLDDPNRGPERGRAWSAQWTTDLQAWRDAWTAWSAR